eukprot:4296409-Pleurochrysis_carterae.AAC.1
MGTHVRRLVHAHSNELSLFESLSLRAAFAGYGSRLAELDSRMDVCLRSRALSLTRLERVWSGARLTAPVHTRAPYHPRSRSSPSTLSFSAFALPRA